MIDNQMWPFDVAVAFLLAMQVPEFKRKLVAYIAILNSFSSGTFSTQEKKMLLFLYMKLLVTTNPIGDAD